MKFADELENEYVKLKQLHARKKLRSNDYNNVGRVSLSIL